MNVLVLGAGMMGRAIAYDLSLFSGFEKIIIGDKDTQTRISAKEFLKGINVNVIPVNADESNESKKAVSKS